MQGKWLMCRDSPDKSTFTTTLRLEHHARVTINETEEISMKTEILFHNTDGAAQIWFMEGNKIVSRQDVVGEKNEHMVIGPPWSIVGVGDFNQNGKADILFHNTNGAAQIWNMDGNKIVSRPNVVAEDGSNLHVGLPWSIVGVGDFNQNGKTDILWHNTDGQAQIWFMDGNKIVSRANIVGEDGKSMVIGPPWSIVGVGDFNQNGKADILFHNADDGASQIWLMDGNKIVSRPNVVAEDGSTLRVGPPWSIVGVGDFNQNGKTDILWHNAQDGTAQIWFMDGNRIASRADIVGEKNEHMVIGPPWSIVGVGVPNNALIAGQQIQQKYIEIGGRQSPLGRAIDPNLSVQSNGQEFFKNFRAGQIKITSEGGASAFVTHRMVVRYQGIHCFGKSEATDEPYAIVGVYAIDARDKIVVKKFPIGRDSYTNFVASTDESDPNEISLDLAPQTLVIVSTVMEHDSGDPDRVAAKVEDSLKKAAIAAGADAGEVSVFTGILDDLGIPGLIADVLGVGDDLIGSGALPLNITDIIPKRPMQKFGNISWNFDSPLLSDGDASYKLYYEVFVEEISPPKVL
jgi:5-keto 4-deoxyuronate isomerase